MNIIDNYRKLPIGKYLRIGHVRKDESMTDLDKEVEILALLADVSTDDILNAPIAEFQQMAIKARFLSSLEPSDANPVMKAYVCGGFELVPVMDHRKIITAQYIDFQEYARSGEDKVVEILSCLLIPKGHKYNEGYDVMEVQTAIRDQMSVADVLALTAFFLTSFSGLITDSLTSLIKEVKAMPDKTKRKAMMAKVEELTGLLRSAGVGLPTLTQ